MRGTQGQASGNARGTLYDIRDMQCQLNLQPAIRCVPKAACISFISEPNTAEVDQGGFCAKGKARINHHATTLAHSKKNGEKPWCYWKHMDKHQARKTCVEIKKNGVLPDCKLLSFRCCVLRCDACNAQSGPCRHCFAIAQDLWSMTMWLQLTQQPWSSTMC